MFILPVAIAILLLGGVLPIFQIRRIDKQFNEENVYLFTQTDDYDEVAAYRALERMLANRLGIAVEEQCTLNNFSQTELASGAVQMIKNEEPSGEYDYFRRYISSVAAVEQYVTSLDITEEQKEDMHLELENCVITLRILPISMKH